MYIGETSSYSSSVDTERTFLLQSKPHSDGVVSFFQEVHPEDERSPGRCIPPTPPNPPSPECKAMVKQENTRLFVSLRDQLIS